MDRVQHPLVLDNYGLHLYATVGDDEGVQRALDSGANVNVLDPSGRSVVMCAVAGDNWETIDASDASFMTLKRLNVLRMLLARPDISLYTLNLPQATMNGVIPLGMAAWLGFPEAVRTLLEGSANKMCVDGMDSHGATALMYAARDGNLAVVKLLLSHGARPDFRDLNHRTSVQFALPHPRILWLCELVLRRHRWRESETPQRSRLYCNEPLLDLMGPALPASDALDPPPLSVFTTEALFRQTEMIVSSITSSDLPFLYSLLFSPPLHPNSPASLYPMSVPLLVNHPDQEGWSPVHHCVAVGHPSIEILDALYCGGADVALFTEKEQWTTLHILAYTSLKSETLEQAQVLNEFALHLVRDLRAPLSARDKDDETCIHIAAEYGSSMEVLMILLDCDSTGVVRNMKNSRGLTALEVCKTEFRAAFGEDADQFRPISALSARTIRPNESYSSLATLSDWGSTIHAVPCTSANANLSNVQGSSPLVPNQSLPSNTNSAPPAATVQPAPAAKGVQDPVEADVITSCYQLVTNLRTTSPPSLQFFSGSFSYAQLSHYESILNQTNHLTSSILAYYRARLEEATTELETLQAHYKSIVELNVGVSSVANERLIREGMDPLPWLSSKRDSEDSQMTAVSSHGHSSINSLKMLALAREMTVKDGSASKAARLKAMFSSSSTQLHSTSSLPDDLRTRFTNASPTSKRSSRDGTQKRTHVSVSTQTYLFDFLDLNGISHCDLSATHWPEWFDDILRHRSDDPTGLCVTPEEKMLIGKLLDAEREIKQYEKQLITTVTTPWAIAGHRTPSRTPLSRSSTFDSALATAREKDTKLKQLLKKKKRIEEKVNELMVATTADMSSGHNKAGTAKFKAWIKKKLVVMHERSHIGSPNHGDKAQVPRRRLEIVMELDESGCNVGRTVAGAPMISISPAGDGGGGGDARTPSFVVRVQEFDPVVENALKTSKSVLGAAKRDLMNIAHCLASVEKCLDLANRSVARFDRVAKRACRHRQTILSHFRQRLDYELNQSDIFVRPKSSTSSPTPTGTSFSNQVASLAAKRPSTTGSPGLLGYSESSSSFGISSRPSAISLASVSSVSSVSSHPLARSTPSPPQSPGSATFEANDDEDTRVIRLLLLRRIEANIGGAWDEMDKIVAWLRIVKEAVRGVKRRAYL